MKHQKQSPSPAKPNHLWSLVPQGSAIKQWAKDLSQVASAPFHSEQWSMVGQAVIVVSEDAEHAQEILRNVAQQAGMAFMSVASDEVASNFNEWIDGVPETPVLVYLEPGAWVGSNLEGDDDDLGFARNPSHDEAQAFEFRKAFRHFLEAGLPNSPMVIVTVLKSFVMMEPSLRRSGCFDRRITLPRLQNELLAKTFIEEVGATTLDSSVTEDLTRLGALLSADFPKQRQRRLIQKALQRLCWRERRKGTFDDLMMFAIFGIGEDDAGPDISDNRRSHAVHEAGHALISYLASREKMAPAYCSIKGRGDSFGVVVTPYEAAESISNDKTYADMLFHLRVGLAGRAAEHLLLGAENVSAGGSASDLAKATEVAWRMLGRWGLAPDDHTDDGAASNLQVVIGNPTDCEIARVDALVQPFLQKQFLIILELLRQHKVTLENVANALVTKGYLFQEDFMAIVKARMAMAAY